MSAFLSTFLSTFRVPKPLCKQWMITKHSSTVDNDGDDDAQGVRFKEEEVQGLLCQLRLPRPDCADGE